MNVRGSLSGRTPARGREGKESVLGSEYDQSTLYNETQ
jgi:hypothetical protein